MNNLSNFSGLSPLSSGDHDAYKIKLKDKLESQAQGQPKYGFAFSPANTSYTGGQKFPTPQTSLSNQSARSPSQKHLGSKTLLDQIQKREEPRIIQIQDVEKPFKPSGQQDYQEEKIYNSSQLDSICMRIQNLRKNLASTGQHQRQNTDAMSQESYSIMNYFSPPPVNTQITFRHENELQRLLQEGMSSGKDYQQMINPTVGGGVLEYQESSRVMDDTQQIDFQSKHKENLSPKLLSTHHEDDEIWEKQSQSNHNYSPNKESQDHQNINIHDMLKEKETQIQQETERKYIARIQELEKKASYLDRSLELIEDMKSKFQSVESQTQQYNDLLLKYNNLLYQFNQKPEVKFQKPIRMFSGTTATVSDCGQADQIGTSHTLNDDINMMPTSIATPQNLVADHCTSQGDEMVYVENQKLKEDNQKLMQQIEIMRLRPQSTTNKRSRSASKRLSIHQTQSPQANRILQNNQNILNIKTKNHMINKSHENFKPNLRSKQKSTYQRQCSASRTNQTPKNDLNSDLAQFSKETFASLHKQIDKLKREKHKLQEKLNSTKTRGQMNLQCCCEDLRNLYEQKTGSLEQLAEHWKEKTQLLVGKYYKSLQIVREDQEKMRESTCQQVEQLKQLQENTIKSILQKQMEVQVYYERRLKKIDSENKKLTKRIVNKRNQSSVNKRGSLKQ